MDTLVVDPFWTVFPAFFGADLKTVLRQKNPEAWPAFERGEIDEDAYFSTAFLDRRSIDGAGLRRALHEGYVLLPGIAELLDELKRAGVPMHILSNYPVWYEMLEDKLHLERWAPWTFVSWKTGVRKPDAEAYLGPARALGVLPEQLLFIDDRASNCEAAEAQGLGAVRFESTDKLRQVLLTRGILP